MKSKKDGSAKSYNTKQSTELLEYLRSLGGEHVTAFVIHAYLKQAGKTVGLTTVYRQLDKLVAAGLVNKYALDGTSSACYEYLGEDGGCHKQCFHCKCTVCGELVHLHCETMEGVSSHLSVNHGFELDTKRTVFYGICGKCKK